MLERYGCGTVEVVAGRSRPAGVLAIVLNDGVFLSPEFFASLLVSWFGGFANGYMVRPRQPGSFLFQVAHECIAKEIVLRDYWSSGLLCVKMSLSPLKPASDLLSSSSSSALRTAWASNSSLPSILGPHARPHRIRGAIDYALAVSCSWPGFRGAGYGFACFGSQPLSRPFHA